MKKILFFLSVISTVLFSSSCSKNNEDDEARKKEREQMGEFFNSTKVHFYKGIKIALRSSATVGKDPEFDKARQTLLRVGGEAISLGSKQNDSSAALNPFELLSMAGDLFKAKDILIKTDEDSLPTLLGNIYYVFSDQKSADVPPLLGYKYDNNTEHAIIGFLWLASVKGPQEFAFYEMQKTDENKFEQYDIALWVKIEKSFGCYTNKFSWTGMDKANEYLELCEKNKNQIIASPPFSLIDGEKSGEKSYYQIHSLGAVLKGLNEKQLEKTEEAMKDFELFLSDAEKGGLDNELTWMIGSYVSIKKEDKEKAVSYLSKLENSGLLDTPEKDAIKEVKGYIEQRDNGKALNTLTDKFAMGKIIFHLIKNRVEKMKQIQQLNETKEGKRFLELHNQLNEKAGYLDKMNNNINTDSLTNKAENFVKGLFDK